MASVFLLNTENKATVNHKDFNKENNHCSNLEYMTNIENIQHRTNSYTSYKHNPNAKLSVHEIKEIRKSKLSSYKLADKYGVSQSTILSIKNRETWKWVE